MDDLGLTLSQITLRVGSGCIGRLNHVVTTGFWTKLSEMPFCQIFLLDNVCRGTVEYGFSCDEEATCVLRSLPRLFRVFGVKRLLFFEGGVP